MMHRVTSLIILALVLAACSSQPRGPVTPPPESALAISQWETSGRVGIRTPDDAISGNFTWQHTPETYTLNIVGPFGQGATKLSKDVSQQITLSYEDKTLVGKDARQLLYQELGWDFPVEQVNYWIRGLASPNTKATVVLEDDSLRPTSIKQDGWLVNYRRYTQVDGLDLPQRIQVSKPPFKVNLIINQWTIQ
ncbi:lipoprotein insertase outer membrane protein LolB [Marinomonas sp. THO17]|uniref:lipoprotein insertase outer membrane protein LolB n=1 Tax=Marinomonas sp. THO17 TaxID=3149048 RepID=UPI00336C15C1